MSTYLPDTDMYASLLETRDQGIVLQEATVAGIVRVCLDILHPARRAAVPKNRHVQAATL